MEGPGEGGLATAQGTCSRLGGKALTRRVCSAVWAGEAGPWAPSWVRSVCRAAQPESAPARLQATPRAGRCAVAGRVLWTGLGCSGPGWRVLTSGCFRHLVGSEGEAQPLHRGPIPSSSGAAGRGGPGVFQPPPPALEAGSASRGRGCWAPQRSLVAECTRHYHQSDRDRGSRKESIQRGFFLCLWERRPQSRSWICTRTHLGTRERESRPWIPGVFFIVKP